MIALVQRVSRARVEVDGVVTGSIDAGMLILLGVHRNDTAQECDWLAKKCAGLRIFQDDEGKMNRSVVEAGGQVLVVSQFTLYGDAAKGNRPSFIASAGPDVAEPLYERFRDQMAGLIAKPVPTGVFGAMMDVHLVNDGPVTLIVERKPLG